jgi:hypothetical protein
VILTQLGHTLLLIVLLRHVLVLDVFPLPLLHVSARTLKRLSRSIIPPCLCCPISCRPTRPSPCKIRQSPFLHDPHLWEALHLHAERRRKDAGQHRSVAAEEGAVAHSQSFRAGVSRRAYLYIVVESWVRVSACVPRRCGRLTGMLLVEEAKCLGGRAQLRTEGAAVGRCGGYREQRLG